MHMGFSMILITSVLVVVLSLVPILAEEASETIGIPTWPKVFTNVKELKEYLNVMRDYYVYKGKARYGKRAEGTQNDIVFPDYLRELVQLKLNIPEQVFPAIRNDKKNQNQQQHLQTENDHKENNERKNSVQLASIDLARICGVLLKSDDKPQL